MTGLSLVLINGSFVGAVSDKEFSEWVDGTKNRLLMYFPKMLQIQPVMENEQMAGFKTMVLPMHLLKVKQEFLMVSPTTIEVLCVINKDQDEAEQDINNLSQKDIRDFILEHLHAFSTMPQIELFGLWTNAINMWRAELAGIAVPSGPVPRPRNISRLKLK
ncbi:MAG: hypothetical protein WC444_05305 [Candidatus Paceibacterota bacterium]